MKDFDVDKVRKDFPVLDQEVKGNSLVYLDNAASSQVPGLVIDRGTKYLAEQHSNVHRGVHTLSQTATMAYEAAREKVRALINAKEAKECIFVRGTTEGINLVASSFGRQNLEKGDEIVLSQMEHHSNIVPWQMIAKEREAIIRVVPMDENGELLIDEYENMLSNRTKIVSLGHVSNAIGTINPIKEMITTAHKFGVPVCIDGAQAVPHMRVDVQDLDADFYAFSGHKMFAPTGIGVLYGKKKFLESLDPYQGGGSMIQSVTFEKTTYAGLPEKFEAGTPAIAPAIGLGAAIDYLNSIDLDAAFAYEDEITAYAYERLGALDGVTIIGNATKRASVISFVIKDIHAHDIGTILDQEGIAIRAGHHCAQPVMDFYGVSATGRASFAFYNTRAEVDKLVDSIQKVIKVFS